MPIRRTFLLALLVSSLAFYNMLVFSSSINGHLHLEYVQPAMASTSSPYSLYLPLVSNRFPLETVFGVEMGQITTDGGLDKVAEANTTWVRRNGVLWAEIEPNEGARDWSVLGGLEQELKNASANNLQVILIVRKTPSWAQKVPGSSCGPIKTEKLGAFGNFMFDLVSRYSTPPYNVKYWELWNEPDVSPELAAYIGGDTIPFGCWGDSADPYYGGKYYAEMLKAVYPRIKAADPQAQVLVGGLLLDCDPRGSPSICNQIKHDDRPAKFLEGILLNNGGVYLDGVGFHGYDDYYGTFGKYGNLNWGSKWNTTGPSITARAQYIKYLLNTYHTSGKFIMNTETAMICGGFNDPPGQPPCELDFEQTKAYYITQMYAASIAEGLRASIWYSVTGWRNSDLLCSDCASTLKTSMLEFKPPAQNSSLLTSNGDPRPAYYAYKFARLELGDASFGGEIGSGDLGEIYGIKGYKFFRGNRTIWLLWSLDGDTHLISLFSPPLAAWDALGNSVTPDVLFNVNMMPLYLEWSR